jgi:ribosomal protein L37AE/L43A
MNSEKAAHVRDAINGLSTVAHDPRISPNYPSDGHTTRTRRGVHWTHTGECVKLKEYAFRPARINEAGEIAFGDGPMQPCYEVVLQPLSIPTRPRPTVSIPPAVVHEIAKYNCRLRVTAGLRGEWTPGTIRIRDDWQHELQQDGDRDRCPACQCSRFTLADGVPECERCGERLTDRETAAGEQEAIQQ